MTTRTKDAAIIAIVMVGGVALLVSDGHKVIIGWAWNLLNAFWNTYIAF